MDATLNASLASPEPRAVSRTSALAFPALASLGAGAIHAAAMGVHSEHYQLVLVFAAAAAFQLGWGALALTSSRLWLALIGALGNAVLVAGFVFAKTSGVSFIDGLEEGESVQWADGVAAALASVAVIGVVLWVAFGRRMPGGNTTLWSAAFWIATVPVVIITVTAMVSAASHSHAAGAAGAAHSHGAAAGGDPTGGAAGGAGGHGHAATVVAKPYDPKKPIDLGGVKGVTLKQQAAAENLLASSLVDLPRWTDPAAANADGYHSIGDSVTGYEHYLNTALMSDGRLLDSDYPESLVYQVDRATDTKKLVAAMYIAEPGTTLKNAPKVGGDLMQWHIHNNLCFTPTSPTRVAGLTDAQGNCRAPLVQGNQSPMVHVWITPHACGPFAALEGIAGGQVKEGEAVLCDAAHGHGSA